MAVTREGDVADAQPVAEHGRRRLRLRIATLFSIVIGLVVLVSVGALLAVYALNARDGLLDDMAERFDLAIGGLEERVTGDMEVVEEQLGYLADLYRQEPSMRDSDAGMAFALRSALAAVPQVTATAFVRPDGSSVRLDRGDRSVHINDLADLANVMAVVRAAERLGPDGNLSGWSEPLFSPRVGRSIVVRRQAVWFQDRFEGVLFAGVDLGVLSRYARDISEHIGQTVFILHGRDRVIAHPSLAGGAPGLSPDRPMPAITEVGDTRLARIWHPDRRPSIAQSRQTRSEGHYFFADGTWNIFVYTATVAYGDTPWLIGFHFDTRGITTPVGRFWIMFAIGGGMMVLFVIVAALLGRRLSRPFQRLTDSAEAIQRMDFEAIRPSKGSPIIELDRAGQSFEAMIGGLRVFERYVPKRLVEMIVREGQQQIEADERELTILFIDIVDFSAMAESMTPKAAAALLNGHFARVGACIDAQGGTIDKYIGDGLLAFWGAPERQSDHAARACSAALAIRNAVTAENRRRREQELAPICARIGLHTGAAIVGDIGAVSRINYTVVGDSVNVAARVEDEGRRHPAGDVTILATAETIAAAGPGFDSEEIGETRLRGREQPIVLFRLTGTRETD